MHYGRLLAVASLLLLPLTASSAMGPDIYAVVGVKGTDSLNLRSTASSKAKILATIPFNSIDVRNLGKRSGGWCYVQSNNTKGWVACNFLAEAGNSRYYIGQGYTMPLPIQKQKQLNSSIVSRMPVNARGITGYDPCTGSDWCRISYQGYQGYVQKKYLMSAAPSSPAPGQPGEPTITPQPR